MTSGPAGGGRFSVPESIPLPTIGSYICGQFEQGAPMNGLVALLRPGDPGYVAQPGAATSTPVPSALPATTATPQPQTSGVGSVWLLLIGLAVLGAVALIIARSWRHARL